MEKLFLALKKTKRQNTALIWIGNCLKIGISEIFPFVQSVSHMSYFLPEETLTKWTSDSEKQRNRTPQNLVSKILFPAFSSSLKSQAAEITQASSPHHYLGSLWRAVARQNETLSPAVKHAVFAPQYCLGEPWEIMAHICFSRAIIHPRVPSALFLNSLKTMQRKEDIAKLLATWITLPVWIDVLILWGVEPMPEVWTCYCSSWNLYFS